jgi:hypothetical protein
VGGPIVTGDPLTVLRKALTSEGAQSRYLLTRSRWDEFQAEVTAERAALDAVEALVAAADELRLWEPGRKGYAAAQDKLFAALAPFAVPDTSPAKEPS